MNKHIFSTVIAVLLLLTIIGVGVYFSVNGLPEIPGVENPLKPGTEDTATPSEPTAPKEPTVPGEQVSNEVVAISSKGEQIKAGATVPMQSFAFTCSDSNSIRLQASVLPEDTTYKEVSWSVKWQEANSQDVNSYVSLSVNPDNSCNVNYLKAFDKKIIITATENKSGLSDSCVVDCFKRINIATVNPYSFKCVDGVYYSNHLAYQHNISSGTNLKLLGCDNAIRINKDSTPYGHASGIIFDFNVTTGTLNDSYLDTYLLGEEHLQFDYCIEFTEEAKAFLIQNNITLLKENVSDYLLTLNTIGTTCFEDNENVKYKDDLNLKNSDLLSFFNSSDYSKVKANFDKLPMRIKFVSRSIVFPQTIVFEDFYLNPNIFNVSANSVSLDNSNIKL